MHSNNMLEQAKAEPEKQGLEAYSATIWELRRKGKTYREIAEFLKKRGVPTDHTAVYRLINKGNPLLGLGEGANLLGKVVYESRNGRPLRPFNAGLLIAIERKVQIIPLRIIGPAIWCETHFDLNEAPNHEWLKQLSEELDIRWNPAHPQHLQGRFGFELKFEGNLMAMVCETFNLERYMKKLGTAVSKATKSFQQDGQRFSRLKEMIAARDAEILETHLLQSGESEEELIDGVLKWDEEDADRLTKKFHAIALS